MKPAVCLLSGGLDSATALAFARRDGFACYALSFDYGQRHHIELQAAARVARSLGAVEHKTVLIDLRLFGGSALTADIDVPKDRPASAMTQGIPITYVPARNTIFLFLRSGVGRGPGVVRHFHRRQRRRVGNPCACAGCVFTRAANTGKRRLN